MRVCRLDVHFGNNLRTCFLAPDNSELIAAIRRVLDECGFQSTPLHDVGGGRFDLGDDIGVLAIGLLHGVRILSHTV